MMVATLLLAAVVILNLAIATPAVDSNKDATNAIALKKTEASINDTILEIFHNCKCISYYCCAETNQYLDAARKGILPKELECSKFYLTCCKHPPECLDYGARNLTSTPDDGNKNPDNEIKTSTTTEATTTISTTTTTTSATSNSTHVVRSTEVEIDRGCGVARTLINTRILVQDVESANTISGEVPWIVAIFEKRQASGPYKFKCSGSLIHPRVILTATHCVLSAKAEYLKIVATGKETFQNLGNAENERNVDKIIKHPKYYSGGLYNDIALLILTEEFNYDKSQINSICLPKLTDNFTGQKCLAVGWGQNLNLEPIPLKKVDVPVVEFNHCQDLLRKTRLGEDFNLDSSFLCAGGEEGKDTCKGDGGGPLICLGKEYKYVQAGIVSWGVDTDTCGKVDQPGIYTDVTKFSEWIDEQLKKNNITTNLQ